jgi:single-strand DNA-binding protein
MPNFNKVILMGNITRDPELRHTPSGKAVCNFSLAINRGWTNDAGEKVEDTTFIKCASWGPTGERIAKYLTKGSPLHVEGRLVLNHWTAKDGTERSELSVFVESMQFLGGKPKVEEREQPARTAPKVGVRPVGRVMPDVMDEESGVPF